MLPAKFRVFASFVDSLFSRASQDLSVSAAPQAECATSLSTSSQTSSNLTSLSTSSQTSDNPIVRQTSIRQTARQTSIRQTAPQTYPHPASRSSRRQISHTSHTTSHRAILALLIAVATLFATFIMLPTEKAGAYDIYWRYGGYGYLAATTEDNNGKPISKASNDATTAERDVYINPQVSQDNKSITWEITFNPKGYNKRELGSSYGKNFADDSGINLSLIHI